MRTRNRNARPWPTVAAALVFTFLNPAVGGETREAATGHPNIVFILLDDVGYGDLSDEHTRIQTPAIDQIAAAGISFAQFYVNSSICSPSRASILTGRHPQRTGILNALASSSQRVLPADMPTIASHLGGLGYTSASIGKWHVGDLPEADPIHRGFDSSIVFLANNGYTDPLLRFDAGEPETVAGHLTDLLVDYAESFVEKATGPWFLNLWFYDAHTAGSGSGGNSQYEPLPRWEERYDDSEQGRYAAHISGADEGIGRLLARIAALDPENNTLVIVTSDNGSRWTDNGHNGGFAGSKGRLLEGGLRVPLIVQWDGVLPAGQTDSMPAQSVDLAPTLMELAGGAVDAGAFDGRSLAPRLLAAGQTARQPTLFWHKGTGEHYPNDRGISERLAIRQGHWKLIFNPVNGSNRLYNLLEDPFEKTNRANQLADFVDGLWDRYGDWHVDVGHIGGLEFSLSGSATRAGNSFQFGPMGGAAVAVPDTRLRIHDGSFSFSAWVRLDALPAADAVLTAKAGAWQLSVDAAGVLSSDVDGTAFAARVGRADRETLVSTTPLAPGQWVHVAYTTYGTPRSANHANLYVNGMLEGNGAVLADIASNDNPVYLGNDSASSRPLVGELRDPRFFSVPLSPAEVQAMAAAGP
ncbi:MAG: sulfatase-like hydrolase/transferase [Pseudomonadota bacterium]